MAFLQSLKSAARRCDALLALPLGAVCTLGFAPYGLWPLSLLALAGLFALAQGASVGRSALLGWLFAIGHFGNGVYWVFISTYFYGGAPWWLAFLLVAVLVALYMSPYLALGLALAARLRLWTRTSGWFALPVLWLLGELLRGHLVFGGFAWLSLGDIALDTPLQRLAPIVGVHGLSALIVLIAYALFRGVAGSSRERLAALVALVAVAAASLLVPAPLSWTAAAGVPLKAAIIQVNISQDEKWQTRMEEPTMMRYRDMTLEARDADLIVWPEAALTQPYDVLKEDFLDPLSAQLADTGTTLLAGVLVEENDGRDYFNSIVALGAGQGRYDKHHLVPFGEYFPIPAWLRPVMDVLDTPYSDISAAIKDRPPITVKGQRLGMAICFEDVFADEFRLAVRDAALIVSVTNDAWFGHSRAAAQHLAMARMRSLETGRVTLRASNTGVSAVIGADGALQQQAGFYTQEILRGSAQPRSGRTPYTCWGDAPLWIVGVGMLLILAFRRSAGAAPGPRAGG
jgi:apolipoprotein N-acyltransferase